MTLLEYAKKNKELGEFRSLNKVWEMIAQELGCHPSLPKLWAYKQRRVNAEKVLRLEEITGGEVLRQHTRPDLYPPQEYD